jgi:hypothetical protein
MKVEEIKLSLERNQKIEFALIDDIAKTNNNSMTILKNGDNAWKAYQDYLTKADAPFKRMISSYDAVTRVEGDSKALSAKVEATAKELGISPSQIKGYDALNANANTAKEIWSTIASFKDPSTFQ